MSSIGVLIDYGLLTLLSRRLRSGQDLAPRETLIPTTKEPKPVLNEEGGISAKRSVHICPSVAQGEDDDVKKPTIADRRRPAPPWYSGGIWMCT